ncbi:hypothetical protein EV13_2134 [Prochlorococcus sp. MIT 0702]|nr:hypothetical protein EV13_2134 [Prochlorococcus sp. MIT 0702]KGG27676.1 hypothetical protein EV12_1106 [Prochlorococcus sp. MIT 0701]KGG31915.1 hypothetical protein EV14_2123 [Prochlorococcus sp. MIT 0703]
MAVLNHTSICDARAISVAILPQFSKVTTEQAAEAMGHDVATHIKLY